MSERSTGVIVLFACLANFPAAAQTVESLVMPGDVAADHAEFESDCAACHKRFDRAAQIDLCLDCHEDVSDDIDAGDGFHGKSVDVSGAQCAICHTDHEGRSADIVGLVESSFDHDLTDYELLGKHRDAECVDCHIPEDKHRDAPGQCIDCHIEDDAHEGSLGEVCEDCHNESDWIDTTFDHDATDFPLVGMHQEVQCDDCHKESNHQNTPTDCYSCHAADDIHEGRSGEQCGDCHNPESWTDTSFNHARDTEFPLLGRHDLLTCNDCHSEDPFSDELETGCVSCHLEDDDHEGHNGSDCEGCHTNDAWSEITFNHATDTEFALDGSHQQVACNDCHVEPVFDESPGTTCGSCHQDDDVHEGKQGEQCQDCHSERSWEEAPFFDHSLTLFPLLGEHENVECVDCHETQVYRDVESECIGCHAEDDPHDDVFTQDCATCHNPVAWDLWLFDHNVQTDFTLDGAHADMTCVNCHRASLTSMQRLGDRCGDCHRADDVHDGDFGFDCGRCHNDRSFKDVRSLQ